MAESALRIAVRGVVIAPDQRVLLIRSQDPASKREFWMTPGGGMEAGETPNETLVRELAEETGLQTPSIGPELWWRRLTFTWAGRTIDQHERYFLVETDHFEPDATLMGGNEQFDFREFRWWAVGEIAESAERFVPRSLATLLARFHTDGAPQTPFDAGR